MNYYRAIIFGLMLISIIIAGCSSRTANPTLPSDLSNEKNLPFTSENESNVSDYLAGFYTAEFNLNSLSVEVTTDRSLAAHFNITPFLPPPSITFNSYDPSTNIIDVDVTIYNDTILNGYDLRLIIFTDGVGHRLLNDDNWTGLFDIPGGLPINPFKAYQKATTDRMFPAKTYATENLHIFLPGGNPLVSFAIEASYPSNCEEPYMIAGFTQSPLYDQTGSTAQLTVDVHDWQDDVDSVQIYCPAITGTPFVPFIQYSGISWVLDLTNNTGAPEGEYDAFLVATSSGISLYDDVTITITHQTTEVEPVGDVSVVSVNRGEGGVPYMRITSVDFDWDDSQGSVEYAIERTDGWQTSTWTVIGTSTSSDFHFIPTGTDLDEDFRFRVIARAEIGGNPNTDADPSEEVFIFFMSDAGYTSDNTWTRIKEIPESGLYFTPWWGSDAGDVWGEGMEGVMGIGEDPNLNMWAITHTPHPVPDLTGMKEAFCDGYMFKGYNWDSPTTGWNIGTLTTPNPSGNIVCDFDPANDIFDPSYWAYNRPNVQGLNEEFCETNQAGWAGQDNDEWEHIGYYLNDLLYPDRDYIAMGLANGDDPLSTGT